MGKYDGFTPDNQGTDKEQVPTTIGYVKDFGEPPLTHHQQAVKDFMIALTTGRDWDTPNVVNKAVELADAFINNIYKHK